MGRRPRQTLIAAAYLALAAVSVAFAAQRNDKDDKDKAQDSPRPKFNLRAQPPVGTTPQRVVLTAELVGGADDFEEYYCPTVEWDWGDDTKSESTVDCEPYESGKTVIKRRFTVEHVFRRPGGYKVFVRLKRRDKAVANASVVVQLRAGGLPDLQSSFDDHASPQRTQRPQRGNPNFSLGLGLLSSVSTVVAILPVNFATRPHHI